MKHNKLFSGVPGPEAQEEDCEVEEKATEIKFCKDCKWNKRPFGWWCMNRSEEFYECKCPNRKIYPYDNLRFLTSGKKFIYKCYSASERSYGNCGIEGKNWEPK